MLAGMSKLPQRPLSGRVRKTEVVSERAASHVKMWDAVGRSPDARVRIAYRGVTTAGLQRHASFKGSVEG